jgi:hypothetical protein
MGLGGPCGALETLPRDLIPVLEGKDVVGHCRAVNCTTVLRKFSLATLPLKGRMPCAVDCKQSDSIRVQFSLTALLPAPRSHLQPPPRLKWGYSFGLENAPETLRRQFEGRNEGKQVLRVAE